MQIPANLDDAALDLKGLGELVTASEWKRAAIVWAFTREGKPGPRADLSTSEQISVSDFAELGVSGLASRTTVTKYRKAWAKAIGDGFATSVRPGDLIDLPDVEWRDYFNPPVPKPDEENAGKPKPRPGKWSDAAWDGEKIDESQRIAKMNEVMWNTLDGLVGADGKLLTRIGQSIIDFIDDDNKARGIARLMHSVIEFASAYKTQQRAA
ncbi:MAG: hypothetical protein WBZ37_08670 [Mycobacterium sp.]